MIDQTTKVGSASITQVVWEILRIYRWWNNLPQLSDQLRMTRSGCCISQETRQRVYLNDES